MLYFENKPGMIWFQNWISRCFIENGVYYDVFCKLNNLDSLLRNGELIWFIF